MLTLALALVGAAPAQAQTRDSVAFEPHWFVQPQVGVGYHVGEAKFGDLLSPAAQLSVGRQFSPVFGLRLCGCQRHAEQYQNQYSFFHILEFFIFFFSIKVERSNS